MIVYDFNTQQSLNTTNHSFHLIKRIMVQTINRREVTKGTG